MRTLIILSLLFLSACATAPRAYDATHDVDRCYKQTFPTCSSPSGGQ